MRKAVSFVITAAGIAAVSLLAVQAKDAEIGSAAPAFSLADTSGKTRTLSEFKGKFVVLEWTNPECPFVKKHYGSGNMQGLQKAWTAKGVVWLTVCSSAEGKQGYFNADEWKKLQKDRGAAPTAT